MQKFTLLISLFIVSLCSSAHADFFHPVTLLDFQCPPGPGYLKMNLAGPNGVRRYKHWFAGSVAACERQQDVLQKTRAEIVMPKFFAVCSPKPSYLSLYSVDAWGNLKYESQTYYGDVDRCLVHADEVNFR